MAAGAGVATYGAGVWLYENYDSLVEKMKKEIEAIKKRKLNKYGVQYALVATRSGCYPDVRGGTRYLNAGDVWKYGETTNPAGRYSNAALRSAGLEFIPEFYGTQTEIKIMEKIKIYNYYFAYGQLPPGNRIFR